MSKQYHCAIFDVDGTLVDSTRAHGMSWHRSFKKSGFDVSFEEITEDIGMGGRAIISKYLTDQQAEQFTQQLLEDHVKFYMKEFIHTIKPFPQASELIHELARRGINIFLASSAPRQLLEKNIDLLKIRRDIIDSVSGSDVTRAKPYPDILNQAMRNCPCDRKDTIVIGDSPFDIEAAQRANLSAIGILNNRPDTARQLLKNALYIFKDIKELYDKVDDLFIKKATACPIRRDEN